MKLCSECIKMDLCDDGQQFTRNIFNLDYLFQKSSWCVKNGLVNPVRLCKYIEQIIKLSTNSFVSHVYIKLCIGFFKKIYCQTVSINSYYYIIFLIKMQFD